MSRLKALHIPFAQGMTEAVDAKVVPDGVLTDLQNGRLHRAGDLRLRRGWRPADMDVSGDDDFFAIATAYEVTDLYSAGPALVALALPEDDKYQFQTYVQHIGSRPWVRRDGQYLNPVTSVRNVGNQPDREANVYRGSAAVTSDGAYGAVLLQTATKTTLRVFKLATDETIYYNDSGLVVSHVSKVVSLGTSFGIVRNSGSAVFLQVFTPTAASAPAEVTLVTAAVTQFDVATAPETTPGALHLVYIVGGEISYAQFTTAGVQVGSTKQVLAAGGDVAYIASDDVTAHVVYQATATGELSLLSFAATGSYTTSAGPTALDAGVVIQTARFAIGLTTLGTDFIWVAATESTGFTTFVYRCTAAHTITETAHNSTQLTTSWVTGRNDAAFGATRGDPNVVGPSVDSVLLDNVQPWLVGLYGQSKMYAAMVLAPGVTDAPFSPGRAPTGDVLTLFARLSDTSLTSNKGDGGQATLQVSARAFKLHDTATRRPGVTFADALYVTGGTLTQVVGGGVAENGFLQPVIATLVESNGAGSIAAGTYTYRAVVRWTDEGGRTHLSPVSQPVTDTYAAPNDTVTATIHVAKTLRRDPNLITNPVVELYRTEAGPGELFYLVASAPISATTTDVVTLTDLLADASIIDNKRLYTEGEFGATSGALDVAPAPSSRFLVPVRDRLAVADRGPGYQFSQIAFPSEAVCFTQAGVSGPGALAYQDSVEGSVTGLASLDDTVIIGTAGALFLTNATGGPNVSGVGEFPSPSRMPSDVGMYNDAALVEDAAGLWFLASADKLFVLPRGQATPVWAGQAVQTRLAAGDIVGAGREIDDDLTIWGLDDGTAVWRTVDGNIWGRDDLPFTPTRFMTHVGRAYAVDDAGAVWFQDSSAFGDGTSGATAVVLQAVTGDVQVFGQAGHGRLATVELLGTYQSNATILCEISYDLGQNWTTLGSHSVTGLSAGQGFQRQWNPARQRGGKFRLRFTMTPASSTAEGCRLTGFSVYFDQRSGPTRLDSAKRR